jgi:hypothetical protein
LSDTKEERKNQVSLHPLLGGRMRKVSIGFLVLGVVVLIAWNWLWLWVPEWLFDLLTLQNGSAWYALTAVPPSTTGAYRILIFHFAEGSNASGFVAWLAGIMKKDAGTGVMVVCGFDVRATPALWQTSLGLFDFWGYPWDGSGR